MEEINTEIKLFNVLKLKYRVEKSQKEVKIFGKEFITKFKNRYKIGYKNKILKLSEYFTIKNDDKDYLELELRIDAKEKIDATYMFDECSALIEITEISRKMYKHKPENQFHYDNNIYNKKDTDELDYWEEILLEKCQDSNIYKNIYDEEASIISENNTVDSGNSTNNIIWPNFNITLIFTNMSCMFYNCISLQYLPDLSNWSTKNVESMRYMFYNCSSLLSLEGISSWNTSNVKDMEGIFDNCKYHRKKKNPERQDVPTLDQAFIELERNGISREMVKGILLTHAHQDHMRCLYPAISACRCSVFCTMGVMAQMLQRCRISSRIQDHHVPVFKEIPFRILDMEITAFETSHDVKSVGFCIEYEGERFVVATDMGIITDRAAHYMSIANYLMIECNYDKDMLLNGRYPQMLKDRVMSEKGHLDNTVAAQFVADHYHDGLHNVFLCHLSKDNNTEEIALATMRNALESSSIASKLMR